MYLWLIRAWIGFRSLAILASSLEWGHVRGGNITSSSLSPSPSPSISSVPMEFATGARLQ
jgi:hypothetical protein